MSIFQGIWNCFGEIWYEIGWLKQSQVVFITGLLGFFTLALGHSINAYLARKRDRAVERDLARNVIAAFKAVFEHTRDQLGAHIKRLDDGTFHDAALVQNYQFSDVQRNELGRHLHVLEPSQVRSVYAAFTKFDTMKGALRYLATSSNGDMSILWFNGISNDNQEQLNAVLVDALSAVGRAIADLERKKAPLPLRLRLVWQWCWRSMGLRRR